MEACNASSSGACQDGHVASATRRKERRASQVIEETKELLQGLHADADRSNALMAELEALLASSHAASRQGSASPAALAAAPVSAFATVQPLGLSLLDAGQQPEEASSPPSRAAGPLARQTSNVSMQQPTDETSKRQDAAVAARRRSSVMLIDGATLFGTGTAGGDHVLLPSARTQSFSRRHGPLRGSSFTEGPRSMSSMRYRNAAETECAALAASQMAGSSNTTAAAGALRHRSVVSELELQGSLASQRVTGTGDEESGSAASGVAWTRQGSGALPPFQRQGTLAGDGEGASLDTDVGAPHDPGASGSEARPEEQGGRSGPHARSGRFMRILKGFFEGNGTGLSVSGPRARTVTSSQTHSGFMTPAPAGQPRSPTCNGMGRGPLQASSDMRKNTGGGGSVGDAGVRGVAGSSAPHGEGQPEGVLLERSCSLTSSGGIPTLRTPHRFNSFHASTASAAAAAQPALAPLSVSRLGVVIPSATSAPVPAAATSQASVRSLSTAHSFTGNRPPLDAASPLSSPLAPIDEGRFAAVPARGSSRLALTCALPQI